MAVSRFGRLRRPWRRERGDFPLADITKPKSDTPSFRTRLRAILDRRWVGFVSSFVLVSSVAVACGYLLTPSIYSERITYGDESLGQICTVVVKAQRDYDIPDEDTTARKRDESSAAVKPIYRYDAGVLTSGLQRVTAAFAMMRDAALAVRSRSKTPSSDLPASADKTGTK